MKYIRRCSLNGTDRLNKKILNIKFEKNTLTVQSNDEQLRFFSRDNLPTVGHLAKAKLTVRAIRWHHCQAHFNGQNNRICI